MKKIRLFCGFVLIFAIIFTIFFGLKKIQEKEISGDSVQYKGIITMWHVDSFEGGKGSRRQFLLKVARAFEKKNQGVLIMVIEHTEESVKEQLKKGVYPDLISYGNGVEVDNLCKLDVNRKINSCVIGGNVYATAWCRGGYVLIENPKVKDGVKGVDDAVLISDQKYTQPLVALLYEGIEMKNYKVLPSMDAYVKFVSNKNRYLLGTQRDVMRLTNRGFEFIAKPMKEYNDLYQYVSITAREQIKYYYANQFVEYLLSDAVQSRLNEIAMLSPYMEVQFEEEGLNALQKAQTKVTISPFTPRIVLEELKVLAPLAIDGDNTALNKIKNIVI